MAVDPNTRTQDPRYSTAQPYGQQNYGQPPYGGHQHAHAVFAGYGAPHAPSRTNVPAIISMAIGSVALALNFTVFLWGLAALGAITGIALGIVGIVRAPHYGQGRGLAIAGLCVSAFAALCALLWGLVMWFIFSIS